MKLVVAGTGYVGLVTAVCFAEHNFYVTCIDIDKSKIISMENGISPIFESDLEHLMKKNKDRLTYSTDYKKAYSEGDVIFVGVGTPEKKDGSANLDYIFKVCEQIKESIIKDVIVVLKSTVPIGTNEKIEKYLNENSPFTVHVVSNPEFLAQGTAVKDTLYPSRIVVGADNQQALDIVASLYSTYNAPIIKTDRRSAEMIKYASNDFLALKISYINEIANFCELVGANIDDVAVGMGYDARIGNKFLNAGIGYGGSCFPKDTKALYSLASFYDFEIKTIKAAIEINERQKLKLIKKARAVFPYGFKDKKIAVLGVTFKPNTDDLREAPSLINIPILLEDGANVVVWDPIGENNFKKEVDGVNFVQTIDQALQDAEACFILTEWQEVVEYDINNFKKLMKNAVVFDGRNCYTVKKMKDIGIEYHSIGR